MWWPAIAFVLVMISPENAAASIATSGVLLMGLGSVLPPALRRFRRAAAAAAGAAATAASTSTGVQDPATIEIELPTIEMPPVGRAA